MHKNKVMDSTLFMLYIEAEFYELSYFRQQSR